MSNRSAAPGDNPRLRNQLGAVILGALRDRSSIGSQQPEIRNMGDTMDRLAGASTT